MGKVMDSCIFTIKNLLLISCTIFKLKIFACGAYGFPFLDKETGNSFSKIIFSFEKFFIIPFLLPSDMQKKLGSHRHLNGEFVQKESDFNHIKRVRDLKNFSVGANHGCTSLSTYIFLDPIKSDWFSGEGKSNLLHKTFKIVLSVPMKLGNRF